MLSLKPLLTIRNTMLAVATVIVILIMVSIAQTQETLKSVDSLIVVDANGKKVGNVISLTANQVPLPQVAFKQDELLFVLNVTQKQLQWGGLAFESSDCTGTPYFITDLLPGVPNGNPSPLSLAATYVPGDTLYVPDSNASPQEIGIGSVGALDPPTPQCQIIDPNLNRRIVIKAIPTVDLSQIFTPPFKVEARPQDSGKGKDKGKGKD